MWFINFKSRFIKPKNIAQKCKKLYGIDPYKSRDELIKIKPFEVIEWYYGYRQNSDNNIIQVTGYSGFVIRKTINAKYIDKTQTKYQRENIVEKLNK